MTLKQDNQAPITPEADTTSSQVNMQNDSALFSAWRRFLDNDKAANQEKGFQTKIQSYIIYLGLIAMLASVTRIYIADFFWIAYHDVFMSLLNLVVIIATLSLLAFLIYITVASRTNLSVRYLAYRLCSNLIQREIYLYRMKAGRYFEQSPATAQRLLRQSVEAAEKRVVDMAVPVAPKHFTDPKPVEAIIGKLAWKNSGDDGVSPISINAYIEQRVLPLKKWFIYRAEERSKYNNRQNILIAVILVVGIISAIFRFDLGFLVSLFLTIALNMWMQVVGSGAVQLLYQPTAAQIDTELDNWFMLSEIEQQDPEISSRIVERLENVIQFQNEMWVLHALFRSESISQQSVVNDVMQNGLSLLNTSSQAISPIRYVKNSVFISYRRADSGDVLGRIYDRLSAYFGKDVIFRDIQTITAGEDFKHRILTSVNECRVLLAIIGTEWLNIVDEDTHEPRLSNPFDFVRQEISTALKQKETTVIPVLVRSAQMPDENDLPDDLKSLAGRNALQVRTDPDFDEDIKRLITAIEMMIQIS